MDLVLIPQLSNQSEIKWYWMFFSPDFVGLNFVFDLLQMQVLFCTSAVALLFSSLQEEIVAGPKRPK
jgi:hypothetical protein